MNREGRLVYYGGMDDFTLDAEGARRLVAAILARAVLDAQRGSMEARDWLAGDGSLWADDLDLPADRVRAWATYAEL